MITIIQHFFMHRNKIMIKNKIVGDTQIPPPHMTTNLKRWQDYKEKYIDTIGKTLSEERLL